MRVGILPHCRIVGSAQIHIVNMLQLAIYIGKRLH